MNIKNCLFLNWHWSTSSFVDRYTLVTTRPINWICAWSSDENASMNPLFKPHTKKLDCIINTLRAIIINHLRFSLLCNNRSNEKQQFLHFIEQYSVVINIFFGFFRKINGSWIFRPDLYCIQITIHNRLGHQCLADTVYCVCHTLSLIVVSHQIIGIKVHKTAE